MAQREMLVDENKRLCDVRPFLAVLNIVERQEDKADNVLNAQISNLIGKGTYCILFVNYTPYTIYDLINVPSNYTCIYFRSNGIRFTEKFRGESVSWKNEGISRSNAS